MSIKCKFIGHNMEFIGNAYEMIFVATGGYDSRRVLRVLSVSHCKRCGMIKGKVLYSWNEWDCYLDDKRKELQENNIKELGILIAELGEKHGN